MHTSPHFTDSGSGICAVAKWGGGGASARVPPLAGSRKASGLGVGKAGTGLGWGAVSSSAVRPLGVACMVSVEGVNSLSGSLVVSGDSGHCLR